MPVPVLSRPLTLQVPARVVAALAGVVALDGLVAGAVAQGLLQGQLPAVSLLVLVVLGAALRLLWQAGEAPALAVWVALPAVIGSVLPGTALAWASLALLGGGVVAQARTPELRRAGLLLAGLGVALVGQALVLKLVAGPLLAVEAEAARLLLQLVGSPAERVGNLVTTGGNQLAVLLGCSGLVNAALGALAFLALTPTDRARVGGAGLVAGLMLLLNTVRLAVMASDPVWYAWLHGGGGSALVDGIGMAVIVAAVEAARERA